MADPATLLEWAQSRYDALNAGLTEMRTRLKSARVALLGDPDDETKPGALANYSTLVTEVASLDDDIAATRREIAAASSPADIEALAEELEDLLIDLSLQKGKLIAASAQLNSAQTEADLAQEAVRQIEREVAEAAATLTEETARKEFHDELKSAIGQEPLSLIQEAAAFVKPDPEDEEEVNEAEDEEAEGDEEEPAEENEEEAEEGGEEVADEEAENAEEAEEEVADDEVPDEAADEEELNPTDFELLVAETQQAYSDAQDQITEDIPEPLRTRAGARRQQVSRDLERKAELTDLAEELLATQRDSHEGSGTVAALVGKQFAFEAAQTAFREFAQHGLEWFESAAALLTRVIGSAEISEADKTAIGDLTAAGAAAAALEQARDEAQADVEDARLAINRKILQVLADDITADAENHADVLALQPALTTAEAALTAAEADLTDDQKGALDEWEASVPEHVWTNLADFLRAGEILDDLKETDAAALVADLDTAESEVLAGRNDHDTSHETLRFLAEQASRQESSETHAQENLQTNQQSALRGEH